MKMENGPRPDMAEKWDVGIISHFGSRFSDMSGLGHFRSPFLFSPECLCWADCHSVNGLFNCKSTRLSKTLLPIFFRHFCGGGLVFCLPFCLSERQKQHILAILRQKGKSEETKRKTKIGRAFLVEKVHFSPNFKQIFA